MRVVYITSISDWFKGNDKIVSFDEFALCTNAYKNMTSGGAFVNCANLERVTMSDTKGAYTTYSTSKFISNCPKLRYFKCHAETFFNDSFIGQCPSIEVFDAPNITSMMCSLKSTKIKSAYFPNCTNLAMYNMFAGCQELVNFYAPKITDIGYDMFNGCSSLKKLDLTNETITHIRNRCFNNFNPDYIVFRCTNVPALDNEVTFGGSYPIYVQDALYDSYITAANWSKYASRIKKLSEFKEA